MAHLLGGRLPAVALCDFTFQRYHAFVLPANDAKIGENFLALARTVRCKGTFVRGLRLATGHYNDCQTPAFDARLKFS
jgi:hypothetical protein